MTPILWLKQKFDIKYVNNFCHIHCPVSFTNSVLYIIVNYQLSIFNDLCIPEWNIFLVSGFYKFKQLLS